MRTFGKFSIALAFAGIIASCAQPDKSAEYEQKLAALDQEIMSPSGEIKDLGKAREFIQISEVYAATLASAQPEKYAAVLAKAAGLAVSINEGEKALALYQAVADKAPQTAKAPMALFMTGFVCENLLKDNNKAKTAYETFLQRYPNDPDYSDDAQNCLKLLGKSPEEIFQQFEKQNQATTK